ncbi:LysR family transcriptional regulator [Herbiconiux sp. L3-i23]|uniref:LysR family transcriptional regulator n=1 Tax=Herbiconiux sp. L3-i23 TaxID=2905871 RepID=UPI0020747169|nr:LysR family transcriptional regulator [Herbiconiux sp. L3-i23]
MDLELRHLRAFLAVADEGSFTDAAIALGSSQAAMSRTVAALERIVGTALFRRTTRSLELTPAGERMLPEARVLVRQAERVHAAAAGAVRPLRIGHSWSALGALTIPVTRSWASAHPDAPLVLEKHNDRTSGLAAGHVDAAIVRHALTDTAYRSRLVGTEPRVAAVAADDPLAARSTLQLRDLVDATVAVDRTTGTTRPELWLEVGLTAAPAMVFTGDVDEWVDRIAAGGVVGISAVSTSHQYPRAGVRYLPLVDAPALEVRLVWDPQRAHPLTDELGDALEAAYRSA